MLCDCTQGQEETFIKSIQMLFMYLFFIFFTFNEVIFCFEVP